MTNGAPDNWGEYRRLILSELERISRDIESTNRKFDKFNREVLVELATIREKARAWGFLGGVIAAAFATALVQIVIRSLTQ